MRLNRRFFSNFWIINIILMPFAITSMSSRMISDVGLIVGIALLTLWIISLIGSGRGNDEISVREWVGVSSTFLFWLPILAFTVWPWLEYSAIGFPTLAACIVIGVFGMLISRVLVSRRSQREK